MYLDRWGEARGDTRAGETAAEHGSVDRPGRGRVGAAGPYSGGRASPRAPRVASPPRGEGCEPGAVRVRSQRTAPTSRVGRCVAGLVLGGSVLSLRVSFAYASLLRSRMRGLLPGKQLVIGRHP